MFQIQANNYTSQNYATLNAEELGGTNFRIQLAVLILSTFLFIFSIGLTFLHVEHQTASNLQKLVAVFDGEVIFELVCLTIGWSCITTRPGIAALRCFRVFRILWLVQIISDTAEPDPSQVFPPLPQPLPARHNSTDRTRRAPPAIWIWTSFSTKKRLHPPP